MTTIKFSSRQNKIIDYVKEHGPITGEKIAAYFSLTRAALRPDLSILTMSGVLSAKPKVGYIINNDYKSIGPSKNLDNISVGDIMSKAVVVDENTSIDDAVIELFLNDSGTLFIENEGNLVGAASRKDFLKFVIGSKDSKNVPVGIIMTRMPNIVVVEETDKVIIAAEKIIKHEVDSLPVVKRITAETKEKLSVIGKISKTNITRLFVETSSR